LSVLLLEDTNEEKSKSVWIGIARQINNDTIRNIFVFSVKLVPILLPFGLYWPLSIELRPKLGAEYLAVLRAMRKRQDGSAIGLIVQSVSGAETLATIRWVFNIVTMLEITKAALRP
jgi:hypothetical protein